MKRVLFLFAELTDEDAEWLARAGTVRRLEAGSLLIAEGAELSAIYIVIDGWLTVTVGSTEVAKMGSGDIAGELTLVDAGAASATVRATAPTTLLEVPRARLQEHIDRDTAFAARMYRAIAVFLSQRLRSSVRRLGYGPTAVHLGEDQETEGEIDADLLGKVHRAGARFDRISRGVLQPGSSQR